MKKKPLKGIDESCDKILIQIKFKDSHISTFYEDGHYTHIALNGASDCYGFMENTNDFIKELEREINNCLWNIEFKGEKLCYFAKERYCLIKKKNKEFSDVPHHNHRT